MTVRTHPHIWGVGFPSQARTVDITLSPVSPTGGEANAIKRSWTFEIATPIIQRTKNSLISSPRGSPTGVLRKGPSGHAD